MNVCISKWRIQLKDFGLNLNKELKTLSDCGLEVSMMDSTAILRMLTIVDDPEYAADQEFRSGIAATLEKLSDTFNITSTIKKIFDTIIKHVRENEPVDTIFSHYPLSTISPDSHFAKEASKEFMGSMFKYLTGVIKDNGYNYEYAPYPRTPRLIEDKSKALKNIRTSEKIVTCKDSNWKVNYTISMGRDETYTHTIDICDYNDFENKTTVTVNTDSHFIRDLDKTIKTAIAELEQGLWSIDRFEKWSGDLSG